MSPLLLSLLCAAPAAPVEAPRPSQEPIEVTFRLVEKGETVFAPTVRTVSGRTAEVRTGSAFARVTPTRLPDDTIRVDASLGHSRPTAAGRTDLRFNATLTVPADATVEMDGERARIVIHHPGGEAAVVVLGGRRSWARDARGTAP